MKSRINLMYVEPLKKRLISRRRGLPWFRPLMERTGFLDENIVLRDMAAYPKHSSLVRVCPGNALGERGAFAESRIVVSGRPETFHIDSGGERKNEIWTD